MVYDPTWNPAFNWTDNSQQQQPPAPTPRPLDPRNYHNAGNRNATREDLFGTRKKVDPYDPSGFEFRESDIDLMERSRNADWSGGEMPQGMSQRDYRRLMKMSRAGGFEKLRSDWQRKQNFHNSPVVPEPAAPPTPEQGLPTPPEAPTGPQAGEEVGYVDDPNTPGNQPMPPEGEMSAQPMPADPSIPPPPPPSAEPPPVAPPAATTAVMPPPPAGTQATSVQTTAAPAEALNTAATMPVPPPPEPDSPVQSAGGGSGVSGPTQVEINVNDNTDDGTGAQNTPPMPPDMLKQAVLPDQYQDWKNRGYLGNIKMLPQNAQMQTGQAPAGPIPPQQGVAPYPQPAPPVVPTGPQSPFRGPGEVPPATPAPGLPGPPGSNWEGSGGPVQAPNVGSPGGFKPPGFSEDNTYGGQQIAGADPSQADYQSVQDYADAAYENQQRYMEPQHAQQNRRMQQELINKGIDPNSPQGQEMQNMMAMQQADQQNAAQFGAMQFGQGIQNQMAQQELAKSGLAGDMQKALWQNQLGSSGQALQKYLGNQQFELGKGQLDLQAALGNQQSQNQRYGQDLNYMLGMGGQDLQRYGMDLQNQLGQGQLDLGRQGQDFNQMLGLEGLNFRDRQYNDQQTNQQQQMLLQMLGMGGTGQGGYAFDPTGAFGQTIGSAGQDKGLLGSLFG